MPTRDERPTNVRYQVLASLCVLSFIFYVDRICISKAAPKIELDLGVSHTGMGYVLAAFTLAYALFEVATGWLGDRYGSRGVMTRIVLWWSFFTALTGAAFGLVSLVIIRFLFGAGEAGAFPNTARILAKWFPSHQRGFAQGLINSTALLGGASAPVAAAYLIEGIGWRWTFVVFSVPGAVWALFFYRWFRDDPAEHPALNASERELIRRGTTPRDKHEAHPAIPWRIVLASPAIWMLGAVLSCTAFNAYMYFSWYPTYLEEGRGVDSITSGWLSSMVLAGGALGGAIGGTLADRLLRLTGSRRWSRRGLGCLALGFSAVFLHVGIRSENVTASAIWTALSVFSAYTSLASWWGAVTDISGRHLGALFGLMNSLGGFGAIGSQLFVGRFTDWMRSHGHVGRAQWDPVFRVYVAVLLLGAVGWLFVDASRSVDVDG